MTSSSVSRDSKFRASLQSNSVDSEAEVLRWVGSNLDVKVFYSLNESTTWLQLVWRSQPLGYSWTKKSSSLCKVKDTIQ